jgi:hypothetical protein
MPATVADLFRQHVDVALLAWAAPLGSDFLAAWDACPDYNTALAFLLALLRHVSPETQTYYLGLMVRGPGPFPTSALDRELLPSDELLVRAHVLREAEAVEELERHRDRSARSSVQVRDVAGHRDDLTYLRSQIDMRVLLREAGLAQAERG